jgi:hypothetical protein
MLVVSLALTTHAFAEDKKYGYESKVGGGKGDKFTDPEKATVQAALDKIKGMTFTDKNATYSGKTIAADLQKMLDDGRMGKGVGAEKGTYATTLPDGKATTDGDRMNIADHHVKDGDNANFQNTLCHEWLHTTQAGGSEAATEAPAYQLGMAAYLAKGGGHGDKAYVKDSVAVDGYKTDIANARAMLPQGKGPALGAVRSKSDCGQEYYLLQNPGKLYFWNAGAMRDSISALTPNHRFFDMITYPLAGACERILIFGSNMTNPSNPIGTITVVDANPTHFFARRDSVLIGTKYPFSVARDTTTGKLYVLDVHFTGQGISILTDTNGDKVPDQRQTFAPHGFAGLDSAEALQMVQHPSLGLGLSVGDRDGRGLDEIRASHLVRFIGDLNHDGIADFTQLYPQAEGAALAPTFSRQLRIGDNDVEVVGMAGHQVQIQQTDATGDPNLGVLGAITIGATAVPQLVSLSSSLFQGEYLKPVDVTNFTQPATPSQPCTGTISATAGAGGQIFPSGNVVVPCGSNVPFNIQPAPCHHIADVLVDGVSVGPVPSYFFSDVETNHTIAASFAVDQYVITTTVNGNGTISPSGPVTVACGSNQTFNFTPDPGFVIRQVVADGDSQGAVASYTFTNVNTNHDLTCFFKTPLVAPPYEPDKWNDGPGDPPTPDKQQGSNNCYRYAVNDHTATGGFARPGRNGGNNPPRPGTKDHPKAGYDCAAFKAAAKADGLANSTKDAVCDNGYKVALVVGFVQQGDDVVQDYHWYRQDADGSWSHKPGGQPATNKDSGGNGINNPETADKGKTKDGTKQYDNFCGYFCVTKATAVQLVYQGGIIPSAAVAGLVDLMRGTSASTESGGGPALASNQISATPLALSGEDDTTAVFTSQADLDSIASMLTGLTPTSDPSWQSQLGYAGISMIVDAVPPIGSERVRVWNNVVRIDQGASRSYYSDSKRLESWLLRRVYGPEFVSVPGGTLPRTPQLAPSHPNPFAALTNIPFALDAAARVELRIYDVSGRMVRKLVDQEMEPGRHQVIWDGRDGNGGAVRSGTYFYKLTLNGTLIGSEKTIFLGQ